MIQVWPTIERFLTEHGAAYRRLDKALGPELGQCCGGRVVVTLEQSGAADLDRVGRLAAVECAGGLTTVAEPGHLKARTAVAADVLPRSVRCARLSDGRVAERLGSDATPVHLFGAGQVGQCLVPAPAPLGIEEMKAAPGHAAAAGAWCA